MPRARRPPRVIADRAVGREPSYPCARGSPCLQLCGSGTTETSHGCTGSRCLARTSSERTTGLSPCLRRRRSPTADSLLGIRRRLQTEGTQRPHGTSVGATSSRSSARFWIELSSCVFHCIRIGHPSQYCPPPLEVEIGRIRSRAGL